MPQLPPQGRATAGRRRGRPGYDLPSVLAVAVEVFNERGYDRTSMRDLAGRLGIAKSAIYHHVTGKEELLRLALDRALSGLSAVQDRARARDELAIARLEYLIRGSVEVLEAELPYVTLLLRVRGNTEVERAALEQRRAFDRFAADLVATAVRDGDIRPDADALITARLLFGLVNSVVEWYRPLRRADQRSLADAVCALAFDGLRTRKAPHPERPPAPPPTRAAPVPQDAPVPKAASVPQGAPVPKAAPVPQDAPVPKAAPVPQGAPVPKSAPVRGQ